MSALTNHSMNKCVSKKNHKKSTPSTPKTKEEPAKKKNGLVVNGEPETNQLVTNQNDKKRRRRKNKSHNAAEVNGEDKLDTNENISTVDPKTNVRVEELTNTIEECPQLSLKSTEDLIDNTRISTVDIESSSVHINEPVQTEIEEIVTELSGTLAKTSLEPIGKPQPVITYVQYESEKQMPMIMKIIQKDLSEPYSIYTYRYFIHNWPKLCFLAMSEDLCVGAIVCKLDIHRKVIKRGYIAMLAVDQNYRKLGIGSTLVRMAIQEMISGEADEVVLETEVTNRPALQLYEQLGFVRDKRLFRYYLNGVDALRLKLWLR